MVTGGCDALDSTWAKVTAVGNCTGTVIPGIVVIAAVAGIPTVRVGKAATTVGGFAAGFSAATVVTAELVDAGGCDALNSIWGRATAANGCAGTTTSGTVAIAAEAGISTTRVGMAAITAGGFTVGFGAAVNTTSELVGAGGCGTLDSTWAKVTAVGDCTGTEMLGIVVIAVVAGIPTVRVGKVVTVVGGFAADFGAAGANGFNKGDAGVGATR